MPAVGLQLPVVSSAGISVEAERAFSAAGLYVRKFAHGCRQLSHWTHCASYELSMLVLFATLPINRVASKVALEN